MKFSNFYLSHPSIQEANLHPGDPVRTLASRCKRYCPLKLLNISINLIIPWLSGKIKRTTTLHHTQQQATYLCNPTVHWLNQTTQQLYVRDGAVGCQQPSK